ncbi:MAG TPA: phosphoribosylformylglycinamidine cyclo-ligase, partial [Nitrolancea sp.]|nr:phosphoribosylformylglycinamidine cyclo-ligase [Nitrolancea sp.]
YYATPELDPEALAEIVAGMADACEAAGCALVGGETAQLPGIYRDGVYDLAGFMVGGVAEDEIVDGSAIRPGDVLVGLPSSGLHTNGFSLARAALGLNGPPAELRPRLAQLSLWSDRSLGEILLTPHRSYLPVIEPLLGTGLIHGMAHITGGGLAGNIGRVVPQDLQAVIELGSWQVPRLFLAIEDSGQIDEAEMYRVFNMGIGFVVILAANDIVRLTEQEEAAVVIGHIVPSDAPERVTLERAGGAP